MELRLTRQGAPPTPAVSARPLDYPYPTYALAPSARPSVDYFIVLRPTTMRPCGEAGGAARPRCGAAVRRAASGDEGLARFASSWFMNVEWPSGELIVAVAASLWAQRLMAEPDHHAGLVRRRWRLERARRARPVCLSCARSSFARALTPKRPFISRGEETTYSYL